MRNGRGSDDIPENKSVPGLVPRPVVCIVRPDPVDLTGTSGLLLEEIGMGPGADQVKFTSFYAINQKPVRFDMDLPVTLPNPA